MKGIALLIGKKLKGGGERSKDLMDPEERMRSEESEKIDTDNPYFDKLEILSGEMQGALEAGDKPAFAKYLYKAFCLMCAMKDMQEIESPMEDDYED